MKPLTKFLFISLLMAPVDAVADESCPTGYFSYAMVLDAETCPAGYFLYAKILDDTSCPSGYFKYADILEQDSCPAGTFQFGGVIGTRTLTDAKGTYDQMCRWQ